MIQAVKEQLAEFVEEHSADIEFISKTREDLTKACARIEQSWSGSFAGWHGYMYFKDFEKPSIYERFSGEWGGIQGVPEGWYERAADEVKLKVEQLMGDGFSVDRFERAVKNLREGAQKLKSEIECLLDSLDLSGFSPKEQALLKGIEAFAFGQSKDAYIRSRLPKTLMSRDSEALRQGTCLPAWLYYEGVALEGTALTEALDEFSILVARTIRMIERKPTTGSRLMTHGMPPLSGLHPDIYKKCHDLYESRAYAEAVEKSFKVVRDELRKLTGYETGSEAFGKGKLHIEGAAAPNVAQDFNDAVKFLTMAIDRFRNEKSHTSDAKIEDPMRAYEYLRLSSLAMDLLENSRILS